MSDFLSNYRLAGADPILAIIDMLRKDPRPDCIDLGVGVYRDEAGHTPIMAAVKAAESAMLVEEKTKTYLGIRGNIAFLEAVAKMVFNSDSVLCSLQTPGGSGALRVLADFLYIEGPKTIWLPNPTWGNHHAIFAAANHKLGQYRYYNHQQGALDFDHMLEDLGKAQKGDVVLLHGVCHNPTGVDLSKEQWQELAQFMVKKELIPFIDIAYLGLGTSLQDDLQGLQIITAHLPAGLVAISASKNFALYRERTGAAFVFSHENATQKAVQSQLESVARVSYSMPPDHGANIVARILQNETLYNQWHNELVVMRTRIQNLRKNLANALAEFFDPCRFAYLEEGRGMFSLLNLNEQAVVRLREEFGIYAVPGGRINIAGLNTKDCPRVAEAIAKLIS